MSIEVIYRQAPQAPSGGGGGADQEIINISQQYFLPNPNGLIIIRYDRADKNRPLPANKDQPSSIGYATITVNGVTVKLPVELEVQGNSSAAMPYKNWDLKFAKELIGTDELSGKAYIKLGEQVVMSKATFKSEVKSPTKTSQYAAMELFNDMCLSRSRFPQFDVDYSWWNKDVGNPPNVSIGARGFPWFNPAVIIIDGQFYSWGFLTTTKDPENYYMSKDDKNALLMRPDGNTSSGWDFYEAADQDAPGAVELRIPKSKDWTESDLLVADNLFNFVRDSTNQQFKDNLKNYVDVLSAIDYFHLLNITMDTDGGGEIMMVTYDKQHWHFLPWDKDPAFGPKTLFRKQTGAVFKSGNKFLEVANLTNWVDERYRSNFLFWIKLKDNFKPELDARYRELREKGVFTVANLAKLFRDATKYFTPELLKAEFARHGEVYWELRPEDRPELFGQDVLIKFVKDRLDTLDTWHGYTPATTEYIDDSFAVDTWNGKLG